ncbi:MAG TPA: DUF2461 family protein [Candidatus Marinimicrobia bacterium]|jgi:hypothetical protein|nr:DUF2461 family protein [Candidatus Neomarinimicrobiota bacterium]HIB29395.1 DUF2461 family protein [Candidatus Neomarinimicrobiota bacterium]HIB52337.1 DUF2461 family protein [Candidatus Neomarinimicrobiota bacterium]HIC37386.1 DUF2461 family protein [Candidatus Neomarinimicrobiota bacterium]HIN97431.1 DUF2461 family protein [Candidatus Neomarinimicrobiota bacterium]
MIAQSTLDFLVELPKNNTRVWYHANKDRFKDAFGGDRITRVRRVNIIRDYI